MWIHARIYRAVEIIESDGGMLIECSCGGHAHVWRGDSETVVGEATCGLWVRLKRRRPWIPMACTVRR
jgi:hypothetical protein